MQNIFLLLTLKKLLPEKIVAIELFGMHGLWHTKDYAGKVHRLDLFELDPHYHRLSKKVFKKLPVNYFNEDSIKYISVTENKYNLAVADIPAGGNFYTCDGMPVFWNDLVRILLPGSVLIFNVHSDKLGSYKAIEDWIRNNSGDKKVRDIFFIARNSIVSYTTVAFQ